MMRCSKSILSLLLATAAWPAADALAQPPDQSAFTHTFGRVFMGDLGNGQLAATELILTNRDPAQPTCTAIVLLNSATTSQSPVFFNGDTAADNTLQIEIPQGGSRKLRITSGGDLITGAVTVATMDPCGQDSISGTGRFEIAEGDQIKEFYSIAPNDPQTWLRDKHCVAISTCFHRNATSGEFGNNLGVALTGVDPGLVPPQDTIFQSSIFDAQGNPIAAPQTMSFDGSHQGVFPLDSFQGLPDGAVTLILCLFSSDPQFQADLTPIQVGTDTQGGVQFDSSIFADGFESGDTSAWSIENPKSSPKTATTKTDEREDQ